MVSIHYNQKDPYRAYAVKHFTARYGLNLKAEGGQGPKTVDIVESQIQDRVVSWMDTDYGRLPLFEEPKGDGYVEETADGIRVNFDVLNAVGRILSGHLEKLGPEDRANTAKIPVVDIYEELLFSAIKGFLEKKGATVEKKPYWPDGKGFAVCATHDVDEIRKTYQYFTRPVMHLARGEFSRALDQARSLFSDKLSGSNPYWTFEDIMKLEDGLGMRSTFYFLQEEGDVEFRKPKTWMLYARKYRFDDLSVTKAMRKLSAGGWEVGLHGSYYSYLDEGKLGREKKGLEEALGKKVTGIRQHHLNLKFPDTWEHQGKTGLEYDTSLGLKDGIGFRWGTCFPFHPLNPNTGQPAPILELPLVVMDTTFFTEKEDGREKISGIIDTVERHGGLLTILFHPPVFNDREYPGWTETYKKIIETCKQKNAWIASGQEISRWWKSRLQ